MEQDEEVSEGSYTTTYRSLDTRIGRWRSVDPAAHLYYSWSPYNLSANNPIQNTDPSGATISPVFGGNSEEQITYYNVLTGSKGLLGTQTPIFPDVYNFLHNRSTRHEIRVMDEGGGAKMHFDDGKGGYYAFYDNSNKSITFNPYYRAPGLRMPSEEYITKASVFEEFFHAAQDHLYGSPGTFSRNLSVSKLTMEVEAKMAKLYSAYNTLTPKEKQSASAISSVFNDWGIPSDERGLLLNENGGINNNVAQYFDKIYAGEDVGASIEESFDNSMKEYAKTIGEKYGGGFERDIKNYSAERELFHLLTKPLEEN